MTQIKKKLTNDLIELIEDVLNGLLVRLGMLQSAGALESRLQVTLQLVSVSVQNAARVLQVLHSRAGAEHI